MPNTEDFAYGAWEYSARSAVHHAHQALVATDVMDGAFEACSAVANRLPVGILTNGFVEIQQAKLQRFPMLDELSSVTVISEEVGVLKPDPRLFAESALRAGMEASEILYVGDSLSSDVNGSIGAGWKVAWYSESTHDHPDVYSFTDWNSIPDLVNRLAT